MLCAHVHAHTHTHQQQQRLRGPAPTAPSSAPLAVGLPQQPVRSQDHARMRVCMLVPMRAPMRAFSSMFAARAQPHGIEFIGGYACTCACARLPAHPPARPPARTSGCARVSLLLPFGLSRSQLGREVSVAWAKAPPRWGLGPAWEISRAWQCEDTRQT